MGKVRTGRKVGYSKFLMSDHPRILGLDVGDRRIGVAISDPLGITAGGLETIHRQNMQADVATIADVVKRHHVVEIVIGLPLNMDGSQGEQAQKAMAFGKKLAQSTGIPVIYEDERLSTISAIRTLTVQGVKTGHNRDLVDRQAAAIILQKHLDRKTPPPTA
jgi:putative Holliday junction resolvase